MSRITLSRFWEKMLWHLWIGRARHPGPGPNDLDIEIFNVGRFLTHGDYALETDTGFLAVIEHRLIPARVRNEWARRRRTGIWSVWCPANQDSGHLGHAGVGLIRLKGAPLSLPTFATAAFTTYFAQGRALRTHIPIGRGFCTWWWCMGSRVLLLILKSLRLLTLWLILCLVSLQSLHRVSLASLLVTSILSLLRYPV